MAKIYTYQGRTATVRDDAEQEFLKQYPGAKLAKKYIYQGKTATVEVDHEQEFLKKYPKAAPLSTNIDLRTARNTPQSVKYKEPEGGFQEFYSQVQRGDVEQPQVESMDTRRYTQEQLFENITEPQMREQVRRQYKVNEAQRQLDEYKVEMADIFAKPEWTQQDADRYGYLADISYFYQNTKLPHIQSGMSADQRVMYEWGKDLADKHPAGSYLMAFALGATDLITSPVTMFDPSRGFKQGLRGMRQGVMGNPEDVIGNMVKSTLYSMPMSIATMALPPVGVALTQTMITGDIFADYMDDGTLTQREALSGAVSGAVQSLIEYGMSMSELKALKGLGARGGAEAIRSGVLRNVQKAFFPVLKHIPQTLATVGFKEGVEEVEQLLSDTVIRHIINGDPLPAPHDFGKELALNFLGGVFGGVVLGGGGSLIQVTQNRNAMARLNALSETYTPAKYVVEAINDINAGNAEKAQQTIRKAKAEMISGNVVQPDIQRAISLVDDALNMYFVGEVQAKRAENTELLKQQEALVKEQTTLEKSKANPERLAEVGRQIESSQRVISKNTAEIEGDETLRKIDRLLDEGGAIAQKASKAVDKALDKLTDSKAYKEATQEEQDQMREDVLRSNEKANKLADKAKEKYGEAEKLDRQAAAREAKYEAARQKAISEQQEAEKASQTQPTEATEEIEVIPDIIDQLEAKKAAIRQERQDINKELTEYRKLMDQQGGWLPSVTPEQKKAYHEVKQRQKEVNRKLNEVGIEIRKEKAAQKKAERQKALDKNNKGKKSATSEDKDGQKDKERVSSDKRQDRETDKQQPDDGKESGGTGRTGEQGGKVADRTDGAEEKPKQRKTYVKTKSGGKTRVIEATRIEGEWIYYTNDRGTESRTKRNPSTQTTNDPFVYRKWKTEHANRSRGAQRAAQKREKHISISQKSLNTMPNLAALQGRVFPPGEAKDFKDVFIPGYGPLCRESKNDQEWTFDTIYENSIPTPEGFKAEQEADSTPIIEAAEKELDAWVSEKETTDTDYWDEAQKAHEEIEYYEKELDKATTEEERQLIRQILTKLDGRVFDDYTEAEQMEMEEAETDGVELNDQGYPASWDEVGTDTRTKSEALQETLPTIPDKTADDALLGMVKSHILSITRKDRTTTVNFKDGRQLVINHITQEAMMTEAGRTGVMYAGRTQGEKGKNVYKAIVDLVDGLNQGNRTLFHESFHVVWKLFLNSEQISYINQYYRAKANKGELVRKYVVTRQGTEMALYWTKEQFNALNRERQAEALEEGAAYGFEHWLGSRTDTAPTTMIGKLWQRLADAIRHALVKLNLASQNAKLTDIFHAVVSDKLTGQGEQGAEATEQARYKPVPTAAEVAEAERQYAEVEAKYKADYLYHGTSEGATRNIIQNGLQPRELNADGDYGAVFASSSIDTGLSFATRKSSTGGYLLRIAKDKRFTPDMKRVGRGKKQDWVAREIIPVDDIDIQGKDSKWYKASGFDVIDGVGTELATTKHNDQWLKAPNGKPTNLNERQWVQVRTQAFKDWFGDWENDPKGKVLDENNEPRPVWHGGTVTTEFSNDKARWGLHFFAYEEAQAKTYGYSVGHASYFIASKKTLDLTNIGKAELEFIKEYEQGYDEWIDRRSGDEVSALDFIETGMLYDYEGTGSGVRWYALFRDARANGYDTIIVNDVTDGVNAPVVVSTTPTNIKSATANVGTFDQSNPDIRYRTITEVETAIDELIDDMSVDTPGRENMARGSLVFMSPDEYLSLCKGSREFLEYDVDTKFGTLDISRILKHIPNLTISSGNYGQRPYTVNGQDGRHRALLLKRAGIKKMPVILLRFNTYEITDEQNFTTLNKEREPDNVILRNVKQYHLSANADRQMLKNMVAEALGIAESNPDIRYRKLTERERAMRDDVWNEIMGRPPTLRVRTRPKVQTEPPEKKPEIVPESSKAEADLNQYTGKTKAAKRDRSTDILTRADDIDLSDRIKQIAAELGVDDKNSDKKFDIIVNAARRMADQNWLTLADNESLRHIVEKIIDTNKPGNADKTDMVLHDDEAMILMQNIGVNREQLHKAGEDGYTLFLQNLAEFAYGNYLIDQKNRLLDEMNEPHTPAEVEQIANAIRIQDGLIEQSRVVNKNVASVAGRILHGQQIMNRARIQEASKQISVLTQRNRQILARVAELRERIAVAQANFNKFKERYEQLRAALNERKPTAERYKTIDEMSDNELLSQLDAAFAGMTNYEMEMESLAGQLDSDIQRIKLNNEMSQKLNTELDTAKKRRKGGRVRITDLPARKADVFDFIDAIAYANALSSLTTHGVNIIATASNSFIETGLNWIASPAASKLSTKIKVDHKKRLNDAVNALRDEVWFWNDNARQRSKDRGKSKYGHAQREVEAGDRHGKRVDRMLWWAYEITNMNTKAMSGEDQLFYTLKYSEQIQSLAAYEARLRTKSKAERQRIAQQLYDHPTPDMIKQASLEAQETCFNQNPTGWFGDFVGVINKIYSSLKSKPLKVSHMVNGKDVTAYDPVAIASRIVAFPLTWTIMPFTRVVANVGNTWIKWTPFGVKNLIDLMDTNPDSHINQQRNIWVDANGRRRVSPYRQRDINRQKARVLVGTLLMSTLMAWAMGVFDDDDDEELAKLKATTKYKQATPSQRAAMEAELVTIRRMGRISGPGPKDYQLLKQLRDTYGYSPWSVKGKDGIWVPYTDHPMAGVLSSVGVVYDYFTWNKPKRPKDFWQYVGISMLGIARAFQDKQFLNNLSDTNEAIMRGDDRWLGRQISGTATRWIPLNANFLRLMDKIFVDDKSYAPETLGQQMLATFPFIPSEKNLPTKTNVAGLPERQASWHNRFVSLPRSDEYMTWTDSNGNGHNMKEIVRIIGGKGAKLPTIRSYEFKLPDGRYIWLYGKDKKEYEILRTSLLNAGIITNEAEIRELATQTDSRPLKTKMATLATAATKDAKKQILRDWDENTLSLKENYSTRIYGDTKTEEEE